jgi:hypothetical protein
MTGASRGGTWLALLRDMGQGLVPWQRTELVAAVSVGTLSAFLDETGIHAGARWCAIAGFLGSPRQWTDFDQSWRRALAAIPGVSDFHAHDFFGGGTPYRTLSRSERRTFIDGLICAVVDHRIFPFGAMVDAEAFNARSSGERRFLTGASRRLAALRPNRTIWPLKLV